MHVTTRLLGCLSVVALLAGSAHAGGFYIPERGARALSMGGAQIAGADDVNAQWLNPAGLMRLRGDVNLYLDMAVIFSDLSFARANDAEVLRKDPTLSGGFGTEKNDGSPFFDPSLGIATNFGLDDWMFALGAYGPYAGTNKWDADGAQRYSLISLEPVQLSVQLSAAWQIHDVISVGLGLQWVVGQVKQRLSISAYPGVFGWAEQRDLDVLAELEVADSFTPSANAGVIITPIDNLAIGISGQLPAKIEAAGELKVRTPAHYYFRDVTVQGDQLELELDFPGIIRLGVQLYEQDVWSVELAAVVEFWSAQETIAAGPGEGGISFSNVPGIGTYNVKPFEIDQRYNDVVSIRLGGSYSFGEPTSDTRFTLRAGGYWESGAPPDETLSALKIDGAKIGVGLGGTLQLGGFDLDVAAAWVGLAERTVTNSIVTQVNPMYEADNKPYGEDEPHVIANGVYNGSYLIFATTLGYAF